MSSSLLHAPRTLHQRRTLLWVLLCTLVVLQFGYPVTLGGPGWTIAYLCVYVGVIWYAIRTAASNPRHYWPVLVGACGLIAGGVWFAAQQDSRTATAGMLAGMAMLQAALLVTLAEVLVRPPVDARTIDLLLVAVCAYLLLGGVFGAVGALLELGAPGSYVDNILTSTEPLAWQSLLYGSYVTLSTLGFGDVVPASAWARSLASLEAVVGTLFLAVVIARLVGVAGFADRDKRLSQTRKD
ncbi:potassium channel family protein [Demequina sp.]|uniref:potassium channel family protein n=1 Tax=Demequina sp. TaxID=2050685 RepID=UPI003A870F1A